MIYVLVRCLLGCVLVTASKGAELLVLRYENAVLRRQVSRVRYHPVGLGNNDSGLTGGQSGCDVVLVGKPAEDLLTADPVVGEVDRLRRLGIGLSWCELAGEAVPPGRVVVLKVFGQHLPQVVLIDDQQSVEEFPAQGADDPFADRVRFWCLRGAGQDPDALRGETASKELVNWPARSLIRNLSEARRWPRSISKLRAA